MRPTPGRVFEEFNNVSMHHAQQTALTFPCRLAIETLHPRFSHWRTNGTFSVVLTVNSGYE